MIFGKAKILRSHGWQYIPDLYSVTLTEEFRGFPLLSDTEDKSDVERAAAICPTHAITTEPLTLDMGRCLFCGECAKCAPRNIRFTNEHRLAATRREDLVVKVGDTAPKFDHSAVRPEISKYFGRALQLREVSAGGDASVEMERCYGQRKLRLWSLWRRLHRLATSCRWRSAYRTYQRQYG